MRKTEQVANITRADPVPCQERAVAHTGPMEQHCQRGPDAWRRGVRRNMSPDQTSGRSIHTLTTLSLTWPRLTCWEVRPIAARPDKASRRKKRFLPPKPEPAKHSDPRPAANVSNDLPGERKTDRHHAGAAYLATAPCTVDTRQEKRQDDGAADRGQPPPDPLWTSPQHPTAGTDIQHQASQDPHPHVFRPIPHDTPNQVGIAMLKV